MSAPLASLFFAGLFACACSTSSPPLPSARLVSSADPLQGEPARLDPPESVLAVAAGDSPDPDGNDRACAAQQVPAMRGAYFGEFEMSFPPEVGTAAPWGKLNYVFEEVAVGEVDCTRPNQRATVASAGIFRFPVRRDIEDDDVAAAMAEIPNFRFYGPPGCDREAGRCWRQEAPVEIIEEPVVTRGFGERRVSFVAEIGGTAGDGQPQTRAGFLMVERGATRYLVHIQTPREHWTALEASIRASLESFRFVEDRTG